MSADQLFNDRLEPNPDITGMVRRNDSASSKHAAKVVSIHVKERDRDRVLKLIADAGERGLTDHCLAHLMSVPGQEPRKQTSVGRRRKDLVDDGLVAQRLVHDPKTMKLIGDRRVPIHGSRVPCDVWVLAHFSQPDGRES